MHDAGHSSELTGQGATAVEHPPCIWEVLGFDSRTQAIPKTLKMVVIASLLGAQELKVSITTDLLVSLLDDQSGSVPDLSHKPLDLKPGAVLIKLFESEIDFDLRHFFSRPMSKANKIW